MHKPKSHILKIQVVWPSQQKHKLQFQQLEVAHIKCGEQNYVDTNTLPVVFGR